ncbi:DUF885 domain-containing protein [Dactylosporangium sp. CS-033363]|uniref:DUF885 domain-containing protein n=1 Tax=Dactylosporangium sp. CS-033363 TaxID=3239935 RepID=UPI003D8F997B
MTASLEPRVHGICNSYVDSYARLYPTAATEFGISGYDDLLPDLSPEGHRDREQLARQALRAIGAAQPRDEAERVAKAVFAERIGLEVEIHAAGLPAGSLNMTWSPVQEVRQAFDLMPADTEQDRAAIARRLRQVPASLAGYQVSLLAAAGHGIVPAIRQVERVVEQCRTWSDGYFTGLAQPDEHAARAAAGAYAELGRFLAEELAPRAGRHDAVGADVYRLWSRKYLGADLDLADAYAWGWEEFGRVEHELVQTAARIAGGGGPAEAAALLDADRRYKISGKDGFRRWLQELSDRALAELRGTHFDIPGELMRLECRIAPSGGGMGAYYTNPADDFSRPGQMWWSLPADREEFSTWRELSTVYHEGVPGHHLQIGTAVATAGLNRFQRLLCFIDGHGEGWALYAERLMREFGYLDDGQLLGMLNKSLFRAARVIVDIGMHLELAIPAGSGFHEGERWTPELGLEFMATRTLTDKARARDEIDRYLGWPGQAPSYKLGERLWLELREEARSRRGAAFDLRQFHMDALRRGPAGLGTLRDLVLPPQ